CCLIHHRKGREDSTGRWGDVFRKRGQLHPVFAEVCRGLLDEPGRLAVERNARKHHTTANGGVDERRGIKCDSRKPPGLPFIRLA
ncbi:MAG TPA: hypothetical protein VIR03_04040, partial [Candidatus Saccharimonadales bacterium]